MSNHPQTNIYIWAVLKSIDANLIDRDRVWIWFDWVLDKLRGGSKIFWTKIDFYSCKQLLPPLHLHHFVTSVSPLLLFALKHHLVVIIFTTYWPTYILFLSSCVGANDEDMKRMTERIFRKFYGLEKKVIKVYGDVSLLS